MKQFIVLMAMIALGIFIFSIVTGSDQDSLRNMSGRAITEAARASFSS